MDLLLLIGLILNFLGIIFLAIGFRIKKSKINEYGNGFYIEGKLPMVLYYENSCLRVLGWIFIIFGCLSQIISVIIA